MTIYNDINIVGHINKMRIHKRIIYCFETNSELYDYRIYFLPVNVTKGITRQWNKLVKYIRVPTRRHQFVGDLQKAKW